jgi:hypothetical protein
MLAKAPWHAAAEIRELAFPFFRPVEAGRSAAMLEVKINVKDAQDALVPKSCMWVIV